MDVMFSVNELILFNEKVTLDSVSGNKVSVEDVEKARKYAKVVSDAGLYKFPTEESVENFLKSVKDFLNSFQNIKF